VKIEFDAVKRDKTLEERGLDFADAAKVFRGRRKSVLDGRKDYGEPRFISIGWLDGRMVVLLWTPTGAGRRVVREDKPTHVSKKPMQTNWNDLDDAPDLSRPEWRAKLAAAPLREGAKIVRRGRPALAKPKQAVSLRLDPDVIAYFKAGGPGWQTRINERLRLVAIAAAKRRKAVAVKSRPKAKKRAQF
jgi:uncharacterized protein (DUF4415 family)/uncharacterized DUF497 family protein